MDILQGLESEIIAGIAKPEIARMVAGWVDNVDPVTHQPRPLIAAADAPEIQDSLYKCLGVIFGLMAENQERKP